LTLQNPHSIRAALAAGAIPPPLFFERGLSRERLGSGKRDLERRPLEHQKRTRAQEAGALIRDQEQAIT
jgi:hypothetical protein